MATLFDYEEDDSPTERRNGLSLSATRKFVVPWAERYFWRGKLLEWYPDPTWTIYPYAPQFELSCQSVQIEPIGKKTVSGSGSIGSSEAYRISYEAARLTAEYPEPDYTRQPTQNPDNASELVSEDYEPTVEYLTLPNGSFVWKTQTVDPADHQLKQMPLDANAAPGILVKGASYSYTRHNAPWVPQAFLDLQGAINTNQIQSKFLTTTTPGPGAARVIFRPFTLLYQGCKIHRSIASTGVATFSVAMKFLHRNVPTWNKFWRAELWDGLYDTNSLAFDMLCKVTDQTTWVKPYQEADFAPLFNAM